jgi:hypothetical protein
MCGVLFLDLSITKSITNSFPKNCPIAKKLHFLGIEDKKDSTTYP